jgi:hypothetical protein
MQRITTVILILLAALLITQAAFSLQWPITHDEAPLLYEAFLMQGGKIPYRDFFDFQMPGSFIAYYLLGIVSGFGPVRLRMLDLFILAVLIVITYFAMRRFGKIPAIAGGILFGLKYLQGGPSLVLQREYLLLVFIALSLLIGLRESLTLKHRLSLGILFGLAAVIKPHAALGLVPFLLFDIADIRQRLNLSLPKSAWTSIFPAAVGFLIPVSLIGIWLALNGALIPFFEIALNYWPLYSQINGNMEVTSSAERMSFLLSQIWRLGGSAFWLVPAGVSLYLQRNRQTYILASLAFVYAIYPALSGQFFPYHYIPFIYMITLTASLVLSSDFQPQFKTAQYSLFTSSLLLITVFITIRPSATFMRQIEGKPIATSTDRAAEISTFFEKNLEVSDEVQPLDWTGGTLLAMLDARAPIATSYIFDFYFYHHVSEPYIQSLRADFMSEIQESKPRFIVEVVAIDKPWVAGEDTSREFPELRTFLDEHYSVTMEKEDYIIYELDDGR